MSSIKIPEQDDLVVVDDAPTVVTESQSQSTYHRTQKPRRRARRPTRAAAAILWTLAAIAGLALWFVFHALVLTSIEQRGSQTRLYAQFREQLALATAPLGGTIKPGSPVALLDAEIQGLRDIVVVEGTTAKQLALGPGHRSDSPLPGQAGNSVIHGRSVTYGAPFRAITRLQAGNKITVTTAQGVFTYRVDRIRRPGDTFPGLPVDASRLTLVTSAAGGWRSGWAPDHAIYLDATLEGTQVKPAPSGRPSAITISARPMQGDRRGLVPLVFWLQALVVVGAGLAWAWRRWGRWQTWLAGAPLALAVLWGASGAAVRLLPNLI